jgi:hypothetical protein
LSSLEELAAVPTGLKVGSRYFKLEEVALG